MVLLIDKIMRVTDVTALPVTCFRWGVLWFTSRYSTGQCFPRKVVVPPILGYSGVLGSLGILVVHTLLEQVLTKRPSRSKRWIPVRKAHYTHRSNFVNASKSCCLRATRIVLTSWRGFSAGFQAWSPARFGPESAERPLVICSLYSLKPVPSGWHQENPLRSRRSRSSRQPLKQ